MGRLLKFPKLRAVEPDPPARSEPESRWALAQEMFQAFTLTHRSGAHLRLRDTTETLCGRDAEVIFPVHPSDKPCHDCYEEGNRLLDLYGIGDLHRRLGTVN